MKFILITILLLITLSGMAQPFVYHVNAIDNSVAIFDGFEVGACTIIIEIFESQLHTRYKQLSRLTLKNG